VSSSSEKYQYSGILSQRTVFDFLFLKKDRMAGQHTLIFFLGLFCCQPFGELWWLPNNILV
jgi:hypothetical protein